LFKCVAVVEIEALDIFNTGFWLTSLCGAKG